MKRAPTCCDPPGGASNRNSPLTDGILLAKFPPGIEGPSKSRHFEFNVTHHPRDTPQFYLTAPSPCPYLPGREERKVFPHLPMLDGPAVNDSLTQGGFRRYQNIAYRH